MMAAPSATMWAPCNESLPPSLPRSSPARAPRRCTGRGRARCCARSTRGQTTPPPPLYRQVKSALLRAIESGQCQAGAALPSEAALAAALGVSIGTLRHATDDLVAEHILVRRQGRGTFVAVHNADRFMFQFFHVERSDGLRQAPR